MHPKYVVSHFTMTQKVLEATGDPHAPNVPRYVAKCVCGWESKPMDSPLESASAGYVHRMAAK